jgi:hypothetical protein
VSVLNESVSLPPNQYSSGSPGRSSFFPYNSTNAPVIGPENRVTERKTSAGKENSHEFQNFFQSQRKRKQFLMKTSRPPSGKLPKLIFVMTLKYRFKKIIMMSCEFKRRAKKKREAFY